MQIVGNFLQKDEEHLDLCKNTLFVKSGILNRGWASNYANFTNFDGLSRLIWRQDFSFYIFAKCEIVLTIHTIWTQNNSFLQKSDKTHKILSVLGKTDLQFKVQKVKYLCFWSFQSSRSISDSVIHFMLDYQGRDGELWAQKGVTLKEPKVEGVPCNLPVWGNKNHVVVKYSGRSLNWDLT